MLERNKLARKIIQITSVGTKYQIGLYALCDDGSVWFLNEADRRDWRPIPKIPQPVSSTVPEVK